MRCRLQVTLPDSSSAAIIVSKDSVNTVQQLAKGKFKEYNIPVERVKWEVQPVALTVQLTRSWWQAITQLIIRSMSRRLREAKMKKAKTATRVAVATPVQAKAAATRAVGAGKGGNIKKGSERKKTTASHPANVGGTTRPSPAPRTRRATKEEAAKKKFEQNQMNLNLPAAASPPAPELRGIVRQAANLSVVDKVSIQQATDLIARMKALVEKVTNDYAPQIAAAKNTVTEIQNACSEKINPLLSAIEVLRGKVDQCDDKLTALEADAAVQATADAQEKEKIQRRTAAAELVLAGKPAEAKRLLQAPSDVQPLKATPVPVDGMVRQTRWKWELVNITKVNANYLTTKDGAITTLVRQFGKATPARRTEIQALLGEGIKIVSYTVRGFETAEEEPEAPEAPESESVAQTTQATAAPHNYD